MAQRRRISAWSRVLGVVSILSSVVAAAVPAATAFSVYRGLDVSVVLAPVSALVAATAAGIGVVLAVAGFLVGRRATSALVPIGLLLGIGVLIGVGIAVLPQS